MDIRFDIDPETGEPPIYGHDVSEEEVEDVLGRPMEDRPAQGGARSPMGQTSAGRHLRVIHVPDTGSKSVFVITA